MSGIEVAGLVLGAYPILIWACGKYKDVFQGMEGWLAFRSRFEEFLLALETERICYSNTLKNLLLKGPSPYFQSIEKAELVLRNPEHEEWRNDELEENLRLRLGDGFGACIGIIKKLNNVMTELYRLLDISRGQVCHS
jgi:hypothetical protein